MSWNYLCFISIDVRRLLAEALHRDKRGVPRTDALHAAGESSDEPLITLSEVPLRGGSGDVQLTRSAVTDLAVTSVGDCRSKVEAEQATGDSSILSDPSPQPSDTPRAAGSRVDEMLSTDRRVGATATGGGEHIRRRSIKLSTSNRSP